MFYVYKIKEKKTDKVLYIGETKSPWMRFTDHVDVSGKFNRQEHYMDVLDEILLTKKEAIKYQIDLQKEFGFNIDGAAGGRVGNPIVQSRTHICKCGKIGKGNKMLAHINKCNK